VNSCFTEGQFHVIFVDEDMNWNYDCRILTSVIDNLEVYRLWLVCICLK